MEFFFLADFEKDFRCYGVIHLIGGLLEKLNRILLEFHTDAQCLSLTLALCSFHPLFQLFNQRRFPFKLFVSHILFPISFLEDICKQLAKNLDMLHLF